MANTTAYDPEKLKKTNAQAANAIANQQQQTASQPQPYQAYDYSGVVNRANQAPAQHQNYDYGKSLGYADRRMQTSNMGQATSLGDVKNQINKAANTLSQPTFQNSGLVGQLTGDILSNLAPVRQQQQNTINQQYDTSKRALEEALAARGGNRGGGAVNQLTGLEQARNQQLAQANAGLVQGALAQALPFGQLALSEKGLLQGQQQTAANQLASLLRQQESSRQWSEGFNADQLQRQFANTLAAQQTQAGENQFGSQFNANQMQQQLENIMRANQLAADENRFGQQFGQQESQFARSLAEQVAARQGQQGLQEASLFGERQVPIDYSNMDKSQLEKAFASLSPKDRSSFMDTPLLNQYLDAELRGDTAGMENILRGWLTQNSPSQTQQTLGAQQLAQQIAQQTMANRYTEAGLTGVLDGQNTLAKQQQDWAQTNARDLLATQLWSAYLQNAPNAGAPQTAVSWINQMFGK